MALKGFGFGKFFQRDEAGTSPEDGVDATAIEHLRANPGTKILIVDDSRTIHAILARELIQYGYDILSAYDGESGVALAREHHPALILMDVVMPGMNGFQATREIRKDSDPTVSSIPVLIMSGNAQPTEEFWSTKIKANGFISKPFNNNELFSYMEHLLFPSASEG